MISSESLILDGIVWRFSRLGRLVLSADTLNLKARICSGNATVVKEGPHRSVYRVVIDDLRVFWKHAKFYGPRGWWRDLLRGPKSLLEFHKLELLLANDIPTIRPLAWGRFSGWWPKGSFLITEAMPYALTLGEYLAAREFTIRERRQLARQLARFVARLHEAGFVHTDLHPGNILIDAMKPDDDWRLIDVHDLKWRRRSLTNAERAENLAMLNRWFGMRTSKSDRCAFWNSYCRQANLPDSLAGEIETITLTSNIKLWMSRDQRARTNNKDFQCVVAGKFHGHVRRDVSDSLRLAMENPEALLARESTTVLKDSRTSKVAVVRIDGRAYLLKRFNIKRLRTPLANLIRPSPGMRSWIGAGAMDNRGLATPRNLIVMHRRSFSLPCEGYLLTEFFSDARTPDQLTGKTLLSVLDETALLVRRMHQTGLAHRDLKASNIVVSQGKVFLIDLVGLERSRKVSLGDRRRDLARLNVSSLVMPTIHQTDRLRWLKRYLAGNQADLADWKIWWKEIARRSLGKLAKNQKNGRPVN